MELNTEANPPRLRRVLKLWDLVFYGIVLIQPIAPVGIFGIAQKLSHGHVSTAVLAAMVAMMLTAFSYGRMAGIYPSAGSAYTYVSRGLNPYVGSLIGWAMVLDYLVIPIVNVVYPALTFKRLFPAVPYAVWAVLIVAVIIFLNLRGIRVTARANEILLAIVSLVVVAFFFTAIRYLLHFHGLGGLVSLQPFYNPKTFDFGALRTATSLAALTYIGFDGVTTLAEEVENPQAHGSPCHRPGVSHLWNSQHSRSLSGEQGVARLQHVSQSRDGFHRRVPAGRRDGALSGYGRDPDCRLPGDWPGGRGRSGPPALRNGARQSPPAKVLRSAGFEAQYSGV